MKSCIKSQQHGVSALSCVIAVVVALAGASAASGQVDTGAIQGLVIDDSGAALPGASVTVTNVLTNQARVVVTNEQGRYHVAALQPSRYDVTVELQGFTTVRREGIAVTVGSVVDANVKLGIAALQETVTVSGVAIVESTRAEMSTVVTSEQIEALPSRGRQYLDFALLAPASTETVSSIQGVGLNIGGARGKEAALLVDGFYNQDEGFATVKQRHSQDSVQEFQIVTFGGTAENGRAIGGIVNVVTKSGSNTIAGSGYGFFRDKRLNALDFGRKFRGITSKSAFSRQQWGGSVGGPLKRDKSFYFLAYERTNEESPFDNGISQAAADAIGLTAGDVGLTPTFSKVHFVMAKWDHSINVDNRIQASATLTRVNDFNPTRRALHTRSATTGILPNDHSYLGKWIRVGGEGNRLHEVKVAYFPRFYRVYGLNEGGPPLTAEGQINPKFQDNTSPPTVTINSVATFGAAVLNNKINTHPVQALYSSTFIRNRHTIKFGADYMIAKFDYTSFDALNGAYSFASLDAFRAGRYNTYSQAFGDPRQPRWHQYISGFVQDSWQVTGRLTMNYGLRYDFERNPVHKQSKTAFGNDPNNFAPRFALAFDVSGKGTTLLKAAAGVYYDRLFQNLTSVFTQIKGAEQQRFVTWFPGDPGAPSYPNTFATLPATLPSGVVNSWIMPDEVNVPTSGQVVVTLEHAVTPTLAVSANVVHTRTRNREYLWDANLEWDESAQRWIRPDSGYRSLLQYRFGGKAEYSGAVLEITKRGGRYGLDGNVTLARAYDSTQDYFNRANDQRLGIEADWGPQTDTPRIRGVVSGWLNLWRFTQVSGIVRTRSGIAVNSVAGGLDLNGDQVFGDRTPTFSRNAFRGPANHSVDLRVATKVPLGGAKAVTFYLEGYNVFNRENIRTVNNDYGPTPGSPRPTWLQPLTWFPPREVQLGMRFNF